MTALRGGDKLENKPSSMSSVFARSSVTGGETSPRVRSFEQLFPLHGDAARGRQMRESWHGFCDAMEGAVRAALDKRRSAPEIAYVIGELVHNYFRTRGVTLASFELRRLVAGVLDLQARTDAPGGAPDDVPGDAPADPALVVFEAEPASHAAPWNGGESSALVPAALEAAFKAPPSALVEWPVRAGVSLDGLLARVIAGARARLKADPTRRTDRGAAREAIDAALGEAMRGEVGVLTAEVRDHLARQALSEICGLGLIDRLWADRSVRAVVVNGPEAVFVERNGRLDPAPERFRDRQHLLDIAARLVRPPASGVAEFRLRDGSEGLLIMPPVAPAGPVLILRRGEPGMATFERLIAAEMLDRPIADLLRVAVRSRLAVLVAGPAGSGKTALLAAIIRDLGDAARIVTLARHRAFRWPLPSKVELVAAAVGEGAASFSVLLSAGARLSPDLLLVDSARLQELPALGLVLSHGEWASVAAVPEAAVAALAGRFDLAVRLGRTADGLFRIVSVADASGARLFVHENGRFRRGAAQPSFAGVVKSAGYGEALSTILS